MTATEKRIFEVAKLRFDRFGFKKTTIDEICKEIQISKKTLYQYFKSKEELFVGLFINEALAARKEIFEKLGHVENPLERLKRIMKITFEYFGQDNFMVRVLKNNEGLYSPFLNQRFQSMVEGGMVDIISEILHDGIEKGIFRKMDEKLMGYLLFRISQSFTYARTIKASKDADYEVSALLDFVTHGIVADSE